MSAQVLSIKKPIEKLVLEIRAHVHDAGRMQTTGAKHQLQAGWRLLELRKRIERGEGGAVMWWDWYDTQFTGHIKSRKYAEKLMKWAAADDPDAAMESDYEKQRKAKRAKRKRDGVAGNSESFSDDPVSHIMRLVDELSAKDRERFDVAYTEKYR